MLKDRFMQALQSKNKIKITFYSPVDRQTLVRICAPLDYGPGKGPNDRSDRFHVWADESVSGAHLLSLNPEQVRRLEILDEEFDPADFVWFLARDWGQHL